MQQCQEIGHDAFHRISYEDLVAIQLDLVFLDFKCFFYLWEIEDTGKVERIIHIQVDLE